MDSKITAYLHPDLCGADQTELISNLTGGKDFLMFHIQLANPFKGPRTIYVIRY